MDEGRKSGGGGSTEVRGFCCVVQMKALVIISAKPFHISKCI